MPEDVAPHATLTVQAGTRPLRVAYLCDPDALDGERVDAITESVLDRWGGRYRGLFPLSGGEIPPSCWPVLESLDPDVVVAMQPLEASLVHRITRRMLPYGIFTAALEPPLAEGGRWLFRDPTNGVDLFGVPQMMALNAGAGPVPQFLNLHERDGRNPHRSFILRNFGLYPSIVAAQAAFERVAHIDLPAEEIGPAALLRRVADLPYHTVTPLELSATGCPPLGLPFAHDHRLGQLHIVVGTTTRDAMLAWNRALHTGGLHRHRTLWVPASLLADDEVRAALVYWLNRTGWRHDEAATLASYEHPLAELEPLAGKLREQLHRVVQCAALGSADYPYPPLQAVARQWINFGKVPGGTRTVTEHVNFADGIGTMAVASPPLQDARFNQGEWMVDVVIPHRPERYSYTNVRPMWTLPKRLSFGPSFFPGIHQARITSTGLPSACLSSTTGRLELRIPSDRALFHWCLAPRQIVDGSDALPRPMFSDFATSDAGRRLRGMLQVFGGLYHAACVFQDTFWRDTLLFMAGERHAATEDRTRRLQQSLQEFLSAHGAAMDADSPALAPLADALARALTPTERRRSRLTPAELKQRFVQVRSACLGDVSFGNYWDVRTSFDDIQSRVLDILLDCGVLFLGVEVRCPQCGVLHWFKVAALGARVTCPGCGTSFLLPAEPEWCYQLNDLVGNALRTAGCLATLQALLNVGNLHFVHEPFVFLPPQDLFKERDASAFTDIDLMCLSEGTFVIGEVKSRAAGFRRHDLERIEEVARAIRPDRVLFASPPGDWQSDALAKLTELSTSLAALDVKVERMDLRW